MADANFTSVISRAQAKISGQTQYFSGKSCPNGHIANRYTSTGSCVECLRERSKRPDVIEKSHKRQAERYLEWKKAQPPKPERKPTPCAIAKAAGLIHFDGNPCSICSCTKRFVTNGQCVACSLQKQSTKERKEYKREWVKRNLDGLKEKREKRYSVNREANIFKAKEWSHKNRDKRLAISKAYKARRRQQEAGGDTTAEIREWEKSQKKVCYWCGSECASSYHLDHYQPLAKGGKHEISNLVIACAACNLKKNAKDPYKFAGLFGKLF